MNPTFRLVRVRGIEIGANWSYLLVFALIASSLANSFFPSAYPGLATTTYWSIALITSVLFVVCLLLHELGHAFRALKEGMEIDGITLWLLGGVARFRGTFPSAGAEFRIAVAGPLVTLVLVGAFGALRWIGQTFPVPTPAMAVLDYLFQINLTLLVFNMIPALPLDGGRVLRSTLWGRSGDFLRATLTAARIANLFAILMMAAGLFLMVTGASNGLFLGLIGWFILQAGRGEVAYAHLRDRLGVPIDDATLREAAEGMERTEPAPRRRAFGGRFLLIVGLIAIGFLYRPPYVTFAPGAAFNVAKDITITKLPDGVKADKLHGKVMLTSVAVQQPSLFGAAAALLQGKDLSPLSSLIPEDIDPDEYFRQQEVVFKEAQTTAAAAAAEAAGMDVEVEGKGARIESVAPSAPAAKVLKSGDVITRINGKRVRLAEDLSRMIRSRPAGTTFEVVLKRASATRQVEVTSRAGIVEDAAGIGVVISTQGYKVDLPFEIAFKPRDIGGPSAGLAYALAIYDLIVPVDLTDGRAIATTGTIEIDGAVGPIGGVDQKTLAAERGKAEIFLVPKGELGQVPDTDVRVVGVETLKDAIAALRTTSDA